MPSTAVRTAVARHAPTSPLRRVSSPHARRPRMNAPELVSQLSKAFDPKAAKAREDERADQRLQTTHMLTMSQQLRDAQTTNDNLRTQITMMQGRIHDVERAREMAELKFELFQTGTGPFGGGRSRRSRAAVYAENPDLFREDGKVRCERIFPGGGGCTQWFSDPSSDDEAEKENRNPSSSSHRSSIYDTSDDLHRDDCFSLHHDDSLAYSAGPLRRLPVAQRGLQVCRRRPWIALQTVESVRSEH
ncbi:hypothetical protein B0H19DRAFT_435482 [Mycena capillaripes]|nr:hypothetical protein B0H19DRAFT_435482 [Mycena capillaripes]